MCVCVCVYNFDDTKKLLTLAIKIKIIKIDNIELITQQWQMFNKYKINIIFKLYISKKKYRLKIMVLKVLKVFKYCGHLSMWASVYVGIFPRGH